MGLKLALLLAVFATLQNGQGLVIELGDASDQNDSLFLGNSCTYFQDYTSFNETECLIDWYKPEESAMSDTVGAWGPCFRQPVGSAALKSCSIIYYGGSLSFPTNVTVEGRVSGKGVITVMYKNSVLDAFHNYTEVTELKFESEMPDDPEYGDWIAQTGLFTNRDNAFVFNFTVTVPDGNSFAMIDRIIIETGDDEPITEPPPPEEIIGEYVLDHVEDQTSVWSEINCAHVDDAQDFWVYGCELDEDVVDKTNGTTGWWKPCASVSCDFIFDSKSSTQRPLMITVDGVFAPGAVMEISRRKTGLGAAYALIGRYIAPANGKSWSFRVPKDCDYDFYKISLINANGVIVVDSLKIEMIDEGVGECSGAPEPTSTLAPTSPTTVTSTSDGSSPTTPTVVSTTGGAGTLVSSLVLPLIALVMLGGAGERAF